MEATGHRGEVGEMSWRLEASASGSVGVDFLSVRGFDGDVAQRIRLTYEFPVDQYELDRSGDEVAAPLYTEA